jgi:hypothetical protein
MNIHHGDTEARRHFVPYSALRATAGTILTTVRLRSLQAKDMTELQKKLNANVAADPRQAETGYADRFNPKPTQLHLMPAKNGV